MDILTLCIVAAGLSMDAFAVAVCKGLAMGRLSVKHMMIVGAWFGGFQAFMPIAGYVLGIRFRQQIVSVDHWIAFGLLGLIGIHMIQEAYAGEDEEADASLAVKQMFPLALATSVDAMAVGVTFAFLSVDILPAASVIGITALFFSMAGVKAGNVFGIRYKAKAEFIGGVMLFLLGCRILAEHTDIFGW